MATKTFKGRTQNKHDTEANWKVAANFKPLAGELIIYDKDNAHSTPRFKVGDGSTLVSDLPFVNGSMEFDTDGFSYEDYGGNVGFFSPMNIILSDSEYKASYGITSIGYKNISTDVEYNLNFPTKSGTFAVTSDIDVTAAGNNTFSGGNTFSGTNNFTGTGNRFTKRTDFVGGITTTGTNDFSVQELYYISLPKKSGTIALTSDIPSSSNFATLSGTNTFSGDTTFTSYVAIRAENYMYGLLASVSNVSNKDVGIYGGGSGSSQEAHVSVGGGNAPYDYTHYCDGKIVTRNTFENDTDQIITIPHKAGVIALTSDIPVANSGTGTTELTSLKIGDTIYTIPSGGGSGDVTAAGDNTFTGNNTFTGDFSRKTRDSSGVIYYKESISDQGFTVGVGATEAATGTQAIYGYGSIKVTAGAAGTGTLSLPVKTGTLALTSDVSAVKTGFFPVGYIYITTSSASPAGIFGGTWEQIKDKFLLAAGDTYTAGSTGGSADAVVVEHRHLQSVSPSSGTDSGVSTWEATTLYNGGNKITAYTSYEGVNGAGKNLPPYLVVHVWKRIA